MANGQLDSLMDITLGALQALQAQNPNVITWFTEPPYAWVPDPCSRTFEFNTTRRAVERPRDALGRQLAHRPRPDRGHRLRRHHAAVQDFFPAYPPLDRFVDAGRRCRPVRQVPAVDSRPGQGQAIFEAKGYAKNANGYYEKDGKELAFDITTHEAFIEKQRIAAVLVEQFQAVGINATTRNEAGSTWGDNRNMGNFEAQMDWEMCGSVNEPWASMDLLNIQWLMPVGERANGNHVRWSGPDAEEYSKLVDEIGTLPLGDPKIDELFLKAYEIYLEGPAGDPDHPGQEDHSVRHHLLDRLADLRTTSTSIRRHGGSRSRVILQHLKATGAQ